MSEPDILKVFNKYREVLFRVCAGAYLHNIGKVSAAFNLDHQNLLQKEDRKQYYFYQHIAGLLKEDSIRTGINLHQDYFINNESIKHFNSKNDLTEKVFEKIKDILTREIVDSNNMLFYPFNDCEYRWGDFIEYLGQGIDNARLYFNKDAKNFKQHLKKIEETNTGHPYYINLIRSTSSSLLTHLMSLCHRGASGGEKDNFYFCKQNKDICAYMATPFGFEIENADIDYCEYVTYRKDAEEKIKQHLGANSYALKLNTFINSLKPTFQEAMADSQRPFNNISVYDIGHSGMALLKSAIWTFKGKKLTHDSFWTDEEKLVPWRLLRFSLNGLGYLSESVSVADLRVRKKKLDQYLCNVKNLLDEQYPVATEVYRDENGSIFVFPDWEENSTKVKSIKQLIDKTCGFNSENTPRYSLAEMYGIEPSRQISPENCMAHPGDARKAKKPYIGTIIKKFILSPLSAKPVPEAFNSIRSRPEPKTDLCPYCELRLISKRVEARKSCQACLNERGDVAKNWWRNEQQGTIWLKEIADDNGRLALVAGRFFPERFIELDYLPGGKQNGKVNKMYSAEAFARQRRIWETCREFWQSIEKDIGKLICSDDSGNNSRLHIKVANIQRDSRHSTAKPRKYHAYELLISGIRLTTMWTGEYFVTLENLRGFKKRNRLDEEAKEWLEKHKKRSITIKISGGYGSRTAVWGQANICEIEKDDSKYLSAMVMLTEPRTFMCLVPAQQALDMVKSIKSKYEKEMGQVRGRLPLHLGVVYVNRYCPLRAILDAGQRMLNQKSEAVIGKLLCVQQKNENKKIFHWQVKGENTPICWPIALKTIGDPRIEDEWYPYLPVCELVEHERQSAALKLDQPARMNSADSVKKIDKMIHVRNLIEGDQVYIYPSTFDFEYLDNAGARFEIAYEQKKRKSLDRAHRSYLLEQVDELNEIWSVLETGTLNRNQIYALRDAISSKRHKWEQSFSLAGETFKQFCRDMLVSASWNKVQLTKREKAKFPWMNSGYEKFFDRWADYAVRGLFEDVVQLHLQIMKDDID